ncbi:MAG: baseplate J/gp47 family protein [Candidatus Deferrimicrobiaceae bacterium]
MAAPTVAQLTEVADTDAMTTQILTWLNASGADINTDAWDEDASLRAVVFACAAFFADRTRITAALANGMYIDYATGGWLTVLAASHYQLDRYEASRTVGDMNLTPDATASLPTSIAIGEIVVVDSVDQQTYRNTTSGTLSTAGVAVSFTFQSEVAGSATVRSTGISTLALQTPISGVTVSNPAISGTTSWMSTQGADKETDAALQSRCKARWGTISIAGGPRSAYEYWARTADSAVTRVQVDDSDPTGTGQVGVYVADDSGAPSASVVTNVDEYINGNGTTIEARHPIGATVTVAAATPVSVSITGSVIVSGQYAATIQDDIEDAFNAFFQGVPIGGTKISAGASSGYVLLGQLYEAVNAVEGVVNFVFTAPLADVALAQGEVAVPDTYPTFAQTVV